MMKFGIFSVDLTQTETHSKPSDNVLTGFTKFLKTEKIKAAKTELECFIKYCAKLLEFDEGNVAAV